MKINFFKLKRNKRYNYTPRYYKGKEEEGSSRFIKYRTVFNKIDFGQKWSEERKKMRVFSNRFFSFRLALIILILTLIFLYVIDFDIKIFKF